MPGDAARVLVVEDDATLRGLLRIVLRDAGYDVVEAADAESALDLLDDVLSGERVDVVVFDNHLGGRLTGIDAITHLRSSAPTRTLPIVLLTSDDDIEARVAGLRAGADDYVVKPFQPEELIARLEARLRERTAWERTIEEVLLEQGVDTAAASTRRDQIRTVLRDEAFTIHVQPIVDLRSPDLTIVGNEALTRFSGGASTEATFRYAASVGLGHDLERATLARVLRDIESDDVAGWVSVNVSPSFLLGDDRLADRLAASSREIVLEISEQEPVDDYAALQQRVRDLGPSVQLSVDDAGSGFASLRHILLLEPDFVKLDRTWVRHVDADPARQALIAGLVHFSTKTGCRLVAEGIETAGELQALEDLGVDYGQGFLLGAPRAMA